MDYMHWQRPQMSPPGLGPSPIDPQNPGAFDGGGAGNSGFADYLKTQGWNGQGMPWQYAMQLRQQGQHPRWQYNHPGQTWGGLGGLAGHMPQQHQPGYEPPHNTGPLPPNMQPPSFAPPTKGMLGANGTAYSQPMNGLAGLARRPTPFVTK
jgi:hypothetical protein